MKTHLFMRPLILTLLLMIGLTTLNSASTKIDKKKKYYVVATTSNWKIEEGESARLTKFYQYYQGKYAKLQEIFITEVDGVMWLAFQAAEGSKGESMMIELKIKDKENLSIVFDEPLGIRNCNKGDGCSQCKVSPCSCGRNGGNGSCIEVVTDKVIGGEPRQILMD